MWRHHGTKKMKLLLWLKVDYSSLINICMTYRSMEKKKCSVSFCLTYMACRLKMCMHTIKSVCLLGSLKTKKMHNSIQNIRITKLNELLVAEGLWACAIKWLLNVLQFDNLMDGFHDHRGPETPWLIIIVACYEFDRRPRKISLGVSVVVTSSVLSI